MGNVLCWFVLVWVERWLQLLACKRKFFKWHYAGCSSAHSSRPSLSRYHPRPRNGDVVVAAPEPADPGQDPAMPGRAAQQQDANIYAATLLKGSTFNIPACYWCTMTAVLPTDSSTMNCCTFCPVRPFWHFPAAWYLRNRAVAPAHSQNQVWAQPGTTRLAFNSRNKKRHTTGSPHINIILAHFTVTSSVPLSSGQVILSFTVTCCHVMLSGCFFENSYLWPQTWTRRLWLRGCLVC